MAINSDNILVRRAAANNDNPSNGGKMTHVAIANGGINNIFPEVYEAERAIGKQQWRKLFWHLAHPSNEGMSNVRVYLYQPPMGDANVLIAQGTHADVQDDLNSPRLYGVATLDSAAQVGDNEITILTQGASYNAFRAGDTIMIHNRASASDVTGYREFHTVDAVSWNGDLATLTLATPLANEFLTSREVDGTEINTVVASCITAGTVQAALVAAPTVSSASGTVDNTEANQIVVDAVGGISDTYTITFSSATAFSCTNAAGDTVGSGNRSNAFQPQNPNFVGRPYFILPANFWAGTWAAGDTLTFSTHPAAIPVWYFFELPANAAPVAASNFYTWLTGNSISQG